MVVLRESSETTAATEAETHGETQAGKDLQRSNLLLRAEPVSKVGSVKPWWMKTKSRYELCDLQVTQNWEVLPSLREELDNVTVLNGSDEETFDNTKESHVYSDYQFFPL